jgi:hypothetical protein
MPSVCYYCADFGHCDVVSKREPVLGMITDNYFWWSEEVARLTSGTCRGVRTPEGDLFALARW